ncbi:unnamed protein product, partial [Meganyctiphanes norvegica]
MTRTAVDRLVSRSGWRPPEYAGRAPYTHPFLPSKPFVQILHGYADLSRTLHDMTIVWISKLQGENHIYSTNGHFQSKIRHNESLAASGRKRALDPELRDCKTGEAILTDGFNLPARYIIHTVGPRYNIKYQTAAESALHLCYRRTLECAVEKKMRTVACCVINSVRRSYPPDQGAHIALRTIRRFLEHWGGSLERLVLVVDSIDVSIYEILMPLYFPRTKPEEDAASHLLPLDLGDEFGEPVIPDRQIRIIDNPQHKYEDVDDATDLASQFQSSVCIGEHSFTHMEEDIDKQRLLGGQPSYTTTDPQTANMTSDLQHKQKYERLLRRAKTEDLKEVSGIGTLYQCGVDKFGRPVIIFVGKWFKFNEINLDKALLYLIYLLDPLVRGDYIVIYFHTTTTADNHPSLTWIREVYEALEYKYKKKIRKFYEVVPIGHIKIM